MTAISLQTLHALGWTLLHFVWQGAALAALFAAALTLSRNANVRYALGLGTLMLMMAAPAVTFAWLNRTPSPAPIVATSVVAASDVTSTSEDAASDVTSTPVAASSTDSLVHALAATTNQVDMMLWLVQAWFVGVMLLSVRAAGGLLWLARTRRGEIEPLSEEMVRQCLILQERMGLRRHIRYGQSRGLDSPAVLGWFRPVVLVTTQAITGLSPQQLQAIIAHELAHIRRYDAFVNLFQVAVEMFLFYHPAVWWVSRRIRIEREVCCDHEALAACGEPVSYARALTMMEQWRAAPSMMMAANRGPLTERVLRLLGMQGTSARSRIAGVGACVIGVAVALFAGSVFVAAAETSENSAPPPVDRAPGPPAPPVDRVPGPPAPPVNLVPGQPGPPVARGAPGTPAPATVATPAPAPRPKANPTPKPSASPRPQVESQAPGEKKISYVGSVEAAGLHNVSIDDLIAMKVQGITPEYVQAMLATHLNPDVGGLIAMKVQGITPEYVQAMLATHLNPDVGGLIAMKVQGITPEYIEELQRIVADVSVGDAIGMKVQGVTPEYIRQMQAAGMDIRHSGEVIAAKVQGITPELVKRALSQGFQDLTISKLMTLQNNQII